MLPGLNRFFRYFHPFKIDVGRQPFSAKIHKRYPIKKCLLLFQYKVHHLLESFLLVSVYTLNINFAMHLLQMNLEQLLATRLVVTMATVEGRKVPMLETVVPQGGLLGERFIAKLTLEVDLQVIGLPGNFKRNQF
jgi:hypothetical protein